MTGETEEEWLEFLKPFYRQGISEDYQKTIAGMIFKHQTQQFAPRQEFDIELKYNPVTKEWE